MAEIQRSGRRYPDQGNNYPTGDRTNYPSVPGRRVDAPSTRYQNYTEFGILRVSVPENWRELPDRGSSVWFAPNGAYGSNSGQTVYTHGVNFGVTQTNNRNLQQATDEFVNALQQGNRSLRSRTGYQRTTVDGRNAL